MTRSKRVREPIQVYLDRSERAQLDRLARELGVSRAEVLRRGLRAVQHQRPTSFYEAFEPLIGAFDPPDTPTDLAEHFDRYGEEELDRTWPRPRPQSS